MSDLFRLAVAAAAGYAVQYQAAQVQSTNAAGETTRLSSTGRFVIGAGAAIAVWLIFPILLGQKSHLTGRSKLAALASGSGEDCGCDL